MRKGRLIGLLFHFISFKYIDTVIYLCYYNGVDRQNNDLEVKK